MRSVKTSVRPQFFYRENTTWPPTIVFSTFASRIVSGAIAVRSRSISTMSASMQPYHAIDDGRWAERVIGAERSQTTYAFRSLIDSGAHVALGSDWFVAPASPLEGIYAAVTRRTLDDRNPDGWVPEQKITVEEALRGYTYEGAYAAFEEDRKGMLKVGMLADMVLIDRDLTAIAPETIREARVLKTIVGGRVVFSRY